MGFWRALNHLFIGVNEEWLMLNISRNVHGTEAML